MFGETKPPTAAQIAAAWGLARYLMSASPAAERRISTAASPPATTSGPGCPSAGNGKTSASTPSTAGVDAADDPGHEVAFEHHRRGGRNGEGLLDGFLVAGHHRSPRPAGDDVRIQHPGQEPQRGDDRGIGPRDLVCRQEVIPNGPGQPEIEVREPVGQRPAVLAADRERGHPRPCEPVRQQDEPVDASRRGHTRPLEDALVVPDQGLVGGFEPDSIESASGRPELAPGGAVVAGHGTSHDAVERNEQVLGGIPAQQARLGEERHVRRVIPGQPGRQEGRDAVSDRCIGDGHAGLAGECAQHEFEVLLLHARPHGGYLELLPAQVRPGGGSEAGRAGHRGCAGYYQDSGERRRPRRPDPCVPASSVHIHGRSRLGEQRSTE